MKDEAYVAAALETTAKQTVLLVKDNDDLVTATETMLRANGFEVVREANADAALQHLNSDAPRPDAVLSDIAMPDSMDGFKLAFSDELFRAARPSGDGVRGAL